MINLEKGGRVNLSKGDNGNKLSKVFFGANWGAIKSGGFLGFGGSCRLGCFCGSHGC